MTRSQPHRVLPARPPPSAGQGLAEAFIRLHAALLPAVRDYLASLDGSMDYHWREDLVQEVFFRAWKNLGCFRGEASVKTFVFAIAKNVFLKELSRRQRPRIVYVNDLDHLAGTYVPDASASQVDPGQTEPFEEIRQAMAQLPQAQRQAIKLDQTNDLPRTQIVKLGKCSPTQFADRLYRAKKRLKQLLRDLPLCILL